MCGIFGMISDKWQSNAESAARMLSHRGPDDCGIYKNDSLCLIHYRLSILDVSANGHQPMISEDGKYVIILNGEIYNHLDIRKDLNWQHFKSTSDTETILYAFAEEGPSIFQKLNGIFALAIYDTQKQELIVVRDQLGVKPLYYHSSESGFVFSSELKSIAALPDMNRDLDIQSLLNYVQYIYSPGNSTPFKSIQKLEAGHFMRISIPESKIIEEVKYYQIPFTGDYLNNEEEYWIDAIDLALQKAVKRQLLSDVPVGYFISGGLDSSLIAAIARSINSDAKLSGFTIRNTDTSKRDGFEDDFPYACKVAELLKIDLQVIDGKIDLEKELDDMIWYQDEPQAEVSAVYVSWIAKLAREQGIYVLLSGLGGDDVFAGYRRHKALHYDREFYKLPFVLRKFIAGLGKYVPSKSASLRRIKKFLDKFKEAGLQSGMANYYKWLQDDRAIELFSKQSKKELLHCDQTSIILESLSNIPNEKNPLNQMLYWDLHFFLSDFNLNYTDKMSMKYGVEVRVPFLDIDLIELSTRIPPELKIKNGLTKYLLKKVAERYLPKEIIYRSKTGFGGPVRQWITYDLKILVEQKLSKESLDEYGVFDYEEVRKLIDDNLAGRVDASYSILSLMAIQSWMNRFI